MSELLRLLTLLLGLQLGVATNFSHENDPWNPVPYAACLRRDLRPTDLVVAHPTLPCRSRVWIYVPRTGRSVVARVGDRGPRSADLDLSPAVTKALRTNGWEPVLFVPEEDGDKSIHPQMVDLIFVAWKKNARAARWLKAFQSFTPRERTSSTVGVSLVKH